MKGMKILIGASAILAMLGCSDNKSLENSGDSSEVATSSSSNGGNSSAVEDDLTQAERIAKNLGLGINFGNALEAPNEGSWGVTLEADYFKLIADSGFKHVRIPSRWDTHVDSSTGVCVVDTTWLSRVRWAVDEANKNGLIALVDQHHYAAMYSSYATETECFLEIWKQVATKMKDVSNDSLVFEVLNEPQGTLTATDWNPILLRAIDTIRSVSPQRTVMVGGDDWNSITGMTRLQLPANDRNIIVTFHFYQPHEFTHQGADWSVPVPPVGTTWRATAEEKKAIRAAFDVAYQWGIDQNRPIYLGEFGAYSKADTLSREIWTEFVASEARRLNIPAAYWEFCSGFGVYDAAIKKWNQYLMNALMHPSRGFDSEINRPNLDTTEYVLLDDFDAFDGKLANLNNISSLLTAMANLPLDSGVGRWYAYHSTESRILKENGDTLVTGDLLRIDTTRTDTAPRMYELINDNGYSGRGLYAKMHLLGSRYPYVGVGTNINGTKEFNLKNMIAMTFWAKGKGSFKVGWVSAFTDTCCSDNWGKFSKEITLTENWKQYVIWYDQWMPSPWSGLEQSGYTWEEHSKVSQIQFLNGQGYGETVDEELILQVDDIRFYGMTKKDFGL